MSSRRHARRAGRQVAAQRLPGLAEVLGDEDVRLVVVGAVAVEGDVARPSTARDGSMLATQHGPGRPTLLGDVRPLRAAVARHPQVAVVGAGPEHVGVARRLGQGRGAALLGARDLRRDRPAGRRPASSERKTKLPRAVEDARVVVRQDERRVPVEAVAAAPCSARAAGSKPRSPVRRLRRHHVAVLARQ